jgi:hypothetical protein
MKKIILLLTSIFILACEPVIEYVEIEKEVIVTETVTETVIEYVDNDVIVTETIEVETVTIEYVDREIVVTEYVEVEIETTKYIEVDKIIEIITEVEVETIVIEEKITEIYIEVPVETVVTEYVEVEIPVTETIIEYVDRIETVVEYVDRIETVTEYVDRVETVTEFVEVDNIVYNETIIYIEKEVYIMAVVEPIKEYDNYITTGNKVSGVTETGFEEIPLIKDLFKIDGVIYFSIDEKMYSQVNNVITEIDILPEVPESENIVFNSGIYKVEKAVYGEEDISKVYKGTSNQARYIIDGACMRGDDLIFSCPIDTGDLLKGVWIWTVNGSPNHIMEGRIW